MKTRNSAFVALCLLAGLILSASAVSATHATNWTLNPEWSAPNVSTTYNASVHNYGPDAIREVFVFRNPNYANDSYNSSYGPVGLQCPLSPLPGWTGVFLPNQYDTLNNETTGACYFYSSNPTYYIKSGTNATFQFNATTPSAEQCLPLQWLFRTIDQQQYTQGYGTWIENTSITVIDNTPPTFTKTVTGPQGMDGKLIGTTCPNGPGPNETCFISNTSTITVNVTDPGSQACQDSVPSRISYCDVNVSIDGQPAPKYSFTVYDNGKNDLNNATNEITFQERFNEDSQHNLSFTCYDRAGNVVKDSEMFKVDKTHPNTNLTITGPEKVNSTATWVDTATRFYLNAVDPDPTGFSCNIGANTTYFRTQKVDPSFCLGTNETPFNFEAWSNVLSGTNSLWYVNGNTSSGAPEYESSTSNPGSWQYVTDPTAPLGDGALQLSINDSGVAWRSLANKGLAFDNISSFGYWTYNNGTGSWPTLQLEWATDCSDPSNVSWQGNLIYSPSLNQDVNGSGPTHGVWQHWEGTDGVWYTSKQGQPYSIPSGSAKTWAQIKAQYPHACISPAPGLAGRIGVKLGTNSGASTVRVDDVNVNDMHYDMEPQGTFLKAPLNGFGLTEQGCNVIQYYTNDLLGNEEPVHSTFVFHDAVPPNMTKTVGTPKVPMMNTVAQGENSSFFVNGALSSQWEADRTFPTGGVSLVDAFGRNNVAQIGVNSSQTASGVFYRTEGIKTTGASNYGDAVQVELYLNPAWKNTTATRTGFWVVGDNGAGGRDGYYGIIDFVNLQNHTSGDSGYTANFTGWRYWDNDHYVDSNVPYTWGTWATLTIVLNRNTSQYDYYVNGQYLGSGAAGNHFIREMFLEAFNFGKDTFPSYTTDNYNVDYYGLGPVKNWYVKTTTPITLSCVDPGQYPSGDSTIHYAIWRSTDNGSTWNNVTDWTTLGGSKVNETDTIHFAQTSMHKLSWYCTDAVNKTSKMDTELFKVDDEAPVISKQLEGPHVGPACPAGTNTTPPNGNAYADCVIKGNNVTHVIVGATDYKQGDAADHYVGGVTCTYNVLYDNEPLMSGSFLGKDGLNLSFNEDSHHVLNVTCQDALGNTANDLESFFVDQTPPTTTKYYREPFVSKTVDLGLGPLEYHWMTTHTKVDLYAVDNSPNKSGVANVSYSIERVNLTDAQCNARCEPPQGYAPNYTTVNGSHAQFYAQQDSCHVIEFYATDKLGNKEQPTTQCVFVDDQAPNFNKTVGQPSIFVGQGGDASGSNGTLVCHDVNTTQGNVNGSLDLAGVGTPVYQVNFSNLCQSGLGVGIAYDGKDLWYSCYKSTTDLYRANPLTGQVVASYNITGGLGAIAYDSGRNVIWAGNAAGNNQVSGQVYKIQLDSNENVVNWTKAFVAQNVGDIMDGLTFDGQDDTFYLSADANGVVQHYSLNGTLLGTFPAAGPQENSGLAIGGQLLYEGMDGASQVWVVNKTNTSQNVFHFSTGGHRDEGLECDPNTFANQNTSVMWSMEAYDGNWYENGSVRTAIAFKVPAGTCGYGGQSTPTQVCEVVNATNSTGTGIDWIVNQSTPVTFSCKDPQPHPVGNEKISFQVVYQGDSRGSENTSMTQNYCANLSKQGWLIDNTTGACAYKVPGGGNVSINFQQDSIHELKVWCSDELGNRKPADVEYFAVDSQPPKTNLSVSNPKYLVNESVLYADNATRFTLTAADPQPHPAGLNATYYYWTRVDNSYCYSGHDPYMVGQNDVPVNESAFQEYTAPFGIPEESCHAIFYYSVDNLGNREPTMVSYVFMDHQPPTIDVSYGAPHIAKNGSDYISNVTPITVTTQDPQPHPSGVNWSEYRYARVNDSFCYGTNESNSSLSSANWTSWNKFGTSTTFKIPEQSCHAIQVYSIDHVAKHNSTTKFVFVDTSAPKMNKTVGKPAELLPSNFTWNYYPNVTGTCNTAGGIDCWKVTTMTPINLSCVDVQPHPVGDEQVHFKVQWDGSDVTPQYCETYNGTMQQNGYCQVPGTHVSQFMFTETTEHRLSFYCSDGLGNVNPKNDTEMFKVEDKAFIIHLNKKWNLISVPFRLLNSQMASVFNQTDKVISVWGFNGTDWHVYTPDGIANDDLHAMLPGYGYWVLTTGPANLTIGGSLFSPAITPPSVTVVPGWNLLGYYGTSGYNVSAGHETSALGYFGPNTQLGNSASCELGSLPQSIFDNMPAGVLSYWEPYNPNQWNTLDPNHLGLHANDPMNPGAGYWVFSTANTDRIYAPTTGCGPLN